jgi:L-fuconolactonase
MRIDAHQHFWRFDPVRDAWITEDMAVIRRDFLPQDLKPLLDESGVRGSVAVQADQSEEETEFLLGLSERHPFILGVVGWVNLFGPNLENRLAHFSGKDRFCGVRHIAQAEEDDFLARDEVVARIGALSDFDLTYDILIYPQQLQAALELVSRLPDQKFVLDHVAKPMIASGTLEPWAAEIRELASHPHVWCKASGLVTEAVWDQRSPDQFAPYLDVVFDAFGPERLMFGSDWPVCLLAGGYGDVYALIDDYTTGLSDSARQQVFGGNAAAFYGLDV